MVKINIKKSRKFTEFEYSLFITFDFDIKIVSQLRKLTYRYFHTESNCWEVPSVHYEAVLKILNGTQFVITNKELLEKNMPDYEFKTTPYNYQLEGIKFGLSKNRFHLGDEQGLGKAVTLDTKVLTPQGFKLMKNINCGDLVIGQNGMPAKVLKTFYHENKHIYQITFSDDTSIKCCNEHLWEVRTSNDIRKGTKRVLTVDDLLKDFKLKYNSKYYIPMVEPVQFDKQDLPLDPYLLGCLIGDGCLGGTSISFTSPDSFIVDKLNKILAPEYTLYSSPSMREIEYRIISTSPTKTRNEIRWIIKELNLNCNSHHKFIPDIYKYNTVENRLNLLQGLMDTDGYISKKGTMQYCSCSEKLCDDVGELIQSLGGIYKKHKRIIKNKYVAYEITFKLRSGLCPVTLPKKLARVMIKRKYEPTRLIKKIEYIGQQPAKCITVDSDNGLYVIENYVVTHNTKQCIDLACIQKQKKGVQHCLIICGVATLRWNWRDEIETHSNEDHCILGLRKRKRKNTMYDGGTTAKIEDLQSIPEAFFWIINVEALRDETIIKILKKYHENGIIGIIITDEVHKIKNPLSAQGKGYLKVVNIKDTEDIRITISGTPLINQPMDLYMIFKSLGYENNSYTAFKNHYCIMGGYMNREIIGYQNLQELKNRLKNIQIRRLKKDVLELPEKLPQTIYVELAKEQMDLYQEVRIALQDKVDLIKLNPNPLAQFTRLRQVTGTPQLISSTVSKSTKLDRLVELVDEIADRGEQCLIFSNWAEVCKIIVDRLKSVNALGYISGCKDLKAIETEFKANPNHVALVGTIKLMGTGLTFNNSNNVIFFDSPWTDADKQQAIDRCHRIGQTSDLNIYTLVCANTIDEKVEKIIQRKHILSDGIVDGGNVMKLEQLINLLLS